MVSIKNQLARVAAVGALGVMTLAGVITPASAASTTSGSVGAGLARVHTATLPNVNIKGSPGAWSPTKLTVTPKPFTTCTRAKFVWTITNRTKKSKVLSWRVGSGAKKPLGTIPAGVKAGVCVKGPAGTKESYFIKGSTSVLHLTLR